MAKHRNGKSNNFWIAVAIIIVAFIYKDAIFALITNSSTLNIFNYFSPQGQLPQTTPTSTCNDYDISLEFIRYFGAANMQTLQQGCINGGGQWVSVKNQVSCHWPSTISFDCDQPSLNYAKQLCNQMKATYTCSNVTKFIGCLCNVAAPSTPLGGWPQPDNDGDQQPEYTCAWIPATTGVLGHCDGTCPDGECCTQIAEGNCQCLTEEVEQHGIGTIFVSSITWSGAMGGLDGADAKCQASAGFASLPGTWKAVMSDSTTSAVSRLPDVPYYNMDGLAVANNRADLFDGSIMNFVNIDEKGNAALPHNVWTGCAPDGTPANPGDLTTVCHNWGWVSDGYFGVVGNCGSNAVGWISNTIVNECKVANSIYCARVA